MSDASIFDQCFAIVIGEEGGYSCVTSDPGNWTSGKVGFGTLKGTKFGIAASSHPTVDIANLTLDQARDIYHNEYWLACWCDKLPGPLALLMFDAAVNNGAGHAKPWLQSAVGTVVDGVIGDHTIQAAHAGTKTMDEMIIEFMAQRTNFMANLSTWHSFGLGWSRRLFALPYHAEQLK